MAEQGAGHEAEQIKEAIWQYTGWAVVLLACMGAGVFIGFTIWGDAATLRKDLAGATEEVQRLKNERVTFESQVGRLTSVKSQLEDQLAECREAAAGGDE